MTRKSICYVVCLTALICLVGFACEDDSSALAVVDEDESETATQDEDKGSDKDTDAPNDSQVEQETDTGSGNLMLDSTHPGFENPGCWANGCHLKASTHNSNLKPHACVECHGDNGARTRTHQKKCVGCHEPVSGHKPNADFNNSGNCSACHG